VRHLARSEDGISGTKLVALLADLEHVLAVVHVEPLFLLVVQVPGRPALFDVDDLGDGEISVRVLGRNLDIDHPGAIHLSLASEPIRTGRYVLGPTSPRAFPCHESAPSWPPIPPGP
jgi:hypothetical protein